MRLLVLVVVWFALSPVVALGCGAFIRAGRGPRLEMPLRALPGPEDAGSADQGPRAASSPLGDLAA